MDEERKLERWGLEGPMELLLVHHLTLHHDQGNEASSVLSVAQESSEECQNRTNEIESGRGCRCEDLRLMLEDGQEEDELEI